jgi:phosphoribosylanthranilate isomerase
MTELKICGLYRDEDIEYANELLPEYIGFVIYYPKSYRSIDLFEAKRLREKLDKRIKVIGVFVNQHIELIKTAYREGIIDIAQLQGDENEEYIRTLKEKLGIEIIKAFTIKEEADLAPALENSADILLFYVGLEEKNEQLPKILERLKSVKRRYILAGGLNSSNVSAIVREIKPHIVDISSGVETDEKKDFEKMKEFIETVRGIN